MDGIHQRFDETVYNRAFKLQTVKDMLASAGWSKSYFTHIDSLGHVISMAEAENQSRIFVVATN
jgi:hypothetical protein